MARSIVKNLTTSIAGLILSSVVLEAHSVSAAVFTVTNTDDSGPGSLRQAVLDANAQPEANIINFSLEPGPQTITLTSGSIGLSGDLKINGPGEDTLTISGNKASSVFSVFNPSGGITNVVISSLSITNGKNDYDYRGGGIRIFSGTLTVNNSTLSDNSADRGGGIYIESSGTLTVNNSTLSGNSGIYGGGIQSVSSTLTVNNSTLSGNSANFGAGIESSGTLTVNNSTLSDNSADFGGGIESSGTLTVDNSTLSGNSANFGAGIDSGALNNVATLTVTNSTINGNSATYGGGINSIGIH